MRHSHLDLVKVNTGPIRITSEQISHLKTLIERIFCVRDLRIKSKAANAALAWLGEVMSSGTSLSTIASSTACHGPEPTYALKRRSTTMKISSRK